MPGISLSKNGHTNNVARAEERLLGISIIHGIFLRTSYHFALYLLAPWVTYYITNILKRARETIAGAMAHAPRTRDEELEDAQRLAP